MGRGAAPADKERRWVSPSAIKYVPVASATSRPELGSFAARGFRLLQRRSSVAVGVLSLSATARRALAASSTLPASSSSTPIRVWALGWKGQESCISRLHTSAAFRIVAGDTKVSITV